MMEGLKERILSACLQEAYPARERLVHELQAAVQTEMGQMRRDVRVLKDRMRQMRLTKPAVKAGVPSRLGAMNATPYVCDACCQTTAPPPTTQGAPPEITGFGAAPPHSFDSNTTQPITLFPPATHPHSQRPSEPQQQPITLFPPAAHPHSQRPSEPQQQSITLFPPTARPHSQLPVGSQQQPLPPVPAPALPSPYPAIDRMLLRKQRVLEAARGARAGRPRSEAAAAPPRPHLPQPPVLVPREGVGGQGCTEGGGTEGGGGGGTRGAHSHRPAALEEHTHRLTMSRVPQGPGCAHMPRPNVHALHAAEAYAALACWRERRAVAAVRIQAAVRGHLCRVRLMEDTRVMDAATILHCGMTLRCLGAWLRVAAVRRRLAHRACKWTCAASLASRGFNGRQVLREEGKYAYAAEWRRHRVLIKALLLLMLHAVGGDQQNTEAEGAASEGSETEV